MPTMKYWEVIAEKVRCRLVVELLQRSDIARLYLALLLAKLPQISPRESRIHGFETTADFLAGRFDARIVNAVRGLSSVGRAPQWH